LPTVVVVVAVAVAVPVADTDADDDAHDVCGTHDVYVTFEICSAA